MYTLSQQMKLYLSDLEKLNRYVNGTGWAKLTDDQSRRLAAWNQLASSWRARHPALDMLLMLFPFIVVGAILSALFLILPKADAPLSLRIIVFAVLHSWLMYSLSIYSLHECAGHRRAKGYSSFRRLLVALSSNLCRLVGADPIFYLQNHGAHHQHLGTEKDATFTNWVQRKRFVRSLLPGAPMLIPSDFFVHIGDEWTLSKATTIAATLIVLVIEFTILLPHFGLVPTTLVLFVLSPWLGACFDRLRDTSEHILRPSDPRLGARDFGLGWYGWLVCGGPWGQPFHLTHHLLPTLPWYQQLRFGFKMRRLLRADQIDYRTPPQLLLKAWRMSAL